MPGIEPGREGFGDPTATLAVTPKCADPPRFKLRLGESKSPMLSLHYGSVDFRAQGDSNP